VKNFLVVSSCLRASLSVCQRVCMCARTNDRSQRTKGRTQRLEKGGDKDEEEEEIEEEEEEEEIENEEQAQAE
jgi:hypothetical protein